jgi:hypothetical protein
MKTAEQVFQEVCGFGLIDNNVSITLTKTDIYRAMEQYAAQKQSSDLGNKALYKLSNRSLNAITVHRNNQITIK